MDKVPDSDTLASYMALWLLWRENSGQYAPGTIAHNKRDVNAILRSPLAELPIAAIKPEDVRNALLWIKQNPARKSGELTNATMNSIYITLNAVFRQAVDDERITRNPMAHIKAPRPDTKEKEALSPDELAALIASLSTLQLDGRVMALYFICYLGLRRSEACALTASSIDGGYCHITQAVKERDGSIGDTKYPASVRTLPMPDALMDKCVEWQRLKERLGWHETPTLCCNSIGGILRPQLLQRWWTGDSKHIGVSSKLGYDGLTLHQIRHSNLSMMARYMSIFDLKTYGGWESIEPARIYIHDDLSQVERAVRDAWR
ncbi:MAG: tyrosine-type recombinase/integrase [Prevotella sp.]|nr:tyrosine-type recombinase/integrase [Prevotella sp.]